jgi:hypothetical protein
MERRARTIEVWVVKHSGVPSDTRTSSDPLVELLGVTEYRDVTQK